MSKKRSHPKRLVESSDSDEDPPPKKSPPQRTKPTTQQTTDNSSSSSESDIENYLHRPDKLNLDSEFFKPVSKSEADFNKIEKEMFTGISRLSESDSETDEIPKLEQSDSKYFATDNIVKHEEMEASSSKMLFDQFASYTKKIEEAQKFIKQYKTKKKNVKEKELNISKLLAKGESKTHLLQKIEPTDLHSSDFESCESEEEGWEEVKHVETSEEQKNIVPKKNIEITIGMPEHVRKKKGIDLLAAMKRRLNRIRKENQILVHKVHLLCWIAHGNYINTEINDTELLGTALSLLPSDQCYPADRTDVTYLEGILNWYRRTILCVEKPEPKNMPLNKSLKQQMTKKAACNKKMFVYIFVAILRSLGIHCRLVLSLQVEPIRPPASELHSLSTKIDSKAKPKAKPSATTSKKDQSNKPVKAAEDKDKEPKPVLKIKITKEKKSETKNQEVNSRSKSTECPKAKKTDSLEVPKNSKRSKSEENTESNRRSSRRSTDKKKISPSEGRKSPVNDRASSYEKSTKESRKSVSEKVKEPKISKAPKKETTDEKKLSKGRKSTAIDNEKSKKKSTEKPVTKQIDVAERSKALKDTAKDNLKASNQQRNIKVPKGTKQSESIDSKKEKVSKKGSKKPAQVDGLYFSSSDDEICIPQLDGGSKAKPNLAKVKKTNMKNKKVAEKDNDDDSGGEFDTSLQHKTEAPSKPNLRKLKTKQIDVRNDIVNLIKGRMKEQRSVDKKKLVQTKRKPDPYSDSDSDYAPEPVKKKHHDSEDEFVPKTKVKRRVQIPGKNGSPTDEGKKKIGNDVWIEVFLEAEEKWICADVIFGKVHCVKELYQRASHPVSYVLAWNNDNTIKEVTKRYCENFNTVTRKLRVDSKWWNDSIKAFLGKQTARDREEDDDLARQQLDQPLPKSIAEYKNHPLYALKRHLLKFEAIYPPQPPTLGFVRGEAVYPRDCVYVLHSRDIWLKQAKVVRLGEQPYKIVKARPKFDKLSNKIITDQLLEIFGQWQVEDYVPPTAENGIVPRNAFGNVDLFKPSMLPFGTVHLKLHGLNRVAKKLHIDCASAIVGFDFHCGWSVPTYDGFIVCKEFEDQLVAAWEKEQEELDQKEQDKIDKRVYGNWRRLIKGLLIRERLKAKYNFGQPSTSTGLKGKKSGKKTRK